MRKNIALSPQILSLAGGMLIIPPSVRSLKVAKYRYDAPPVVLVGGACRFPDKFVDRSLADPLCHVVVDRLNRLAHRRILGVGCNHNREIGRASCRERV